MNISTVERTILEKCAKDAVWEIDFNAPVDCINLFSSFFKETGSIKKLLNVHLFGKFNKKEEAENCMKYIKSKFSRAMLGIKKATQHNPKSTWIYVPLQDFTASSDIDWSKTIPEIDKQLYAKYELSPEEVDFIEKNVKSME